MSKLSSSHIKHLEKRQTKMVKEREAKLKEEQQKLAQANKNAVFINNKKK